MILGAVAVSLPLIARLLVLPGLLDSDWLKAEIKRSVPFPIEIGEISGRGFSGLVMHIHKVVIPSPEGFEGECARIEDITVDASLGALARNDVRLHRLGVGVVKLNFELNQDGKLNVDSLLSQAETLEEKFRMSDDILVTVAPSPSLKISFLNVLVRKLDVILKTPDGIAAEFLELSMKADLEEQDKWMNFTLSAADGSPTDIRVKGRAQLTLDGPSVELSGGEFSANITSLNATAIASAFRQKLPDDFESVDLIVEGNVGRETAWKAEVSAGAFSAKGTCTAMASEEQKTLKSHWVIECPYSADPLDLDLEASTDDPARFIKIDHLTVGMKDSPFGLRIRGSVSDIAAAPRAAGEIAVNIHQGWFETAASLVKTYLPGVQLEKVFARKLMFDATQESISLNGRISLLGLMDLDTHIRFNPTDNLIHLEYLKGESPAGTGLELSGKISASDLSGELQLRAQAPLVTLTPFLSLSGLQLPAGTTLSGQLDTQQKLRLSPSAFFLAGKTRLTNGGLKIAYVIPVTVGNGLLKNDARYEPSTGRVELKELSLTSPDQSLPLNLEVQGEYEADKVQLSATAMLHLDRLDKQFGAWIRMVLPDISVAGNAALTSRITGTMQSPSIIGNLDLSPAGLSFGSLLNKTPGEPLDCLLSGGLKEGKGELVLESNVKENKRRWVISGPGVPQQQADETAMTHTVTLDLQRKNRQVPFLKSTKLDAPVQLRSDFHFVKTPLTPRQVWSRIIKRTEVSAQAGLLTGLSSLPPIAAVLSRLARVAKREIEPIEIASLETKFEKGETALELQKFKLDTTGFVDLDGKGMVDLTTDEVSIKLNIRPDLDWLNALPVDLRPASWNEWHVEITGKWNSPGLKFKGFPEPLLKAIQKLGDKPPETAPGVAPSFPPDQ